MEQNVFLKMLILHLVSNDLFSSPLVRGEKRWLKDGEELTQSAKHVMEVRGNTCKLTLTSLNMADTGEYTLLVGEIKTSTYVR